MLKHYTLQQIIAGCDEAGRGCLAGPVIAAAVILPNDFKNTTLNDSKLLSKKRRNLLREIIEEEADSWAIGTSSVKEIERINIANASFLAMHRAISKLSINPDILLIDGNNFKPYKKIKHKTVIKGDSKYLSIAAASILAKTYRDDIMINLDIKYPEYKWKKNKGYPTKEHREAIQKIGISEHHRKSFQLLSS